MKQNNCIIILFLLIFMIASCQLSEENRQAFLDHQPPLIQIDSPAPFSECFKSITILGSIHDIGYNGEPVKITSLNYTISNKDYENEIEIKNNGNFSVHIDISHFIGDFTIDFQAVDKNNNVITKQLPLVALDKPKLKTSVADDGIIIEWFNQDVSDYNLMYKIENEPIRQMTLLDKNPPDQFYIFKNPCPGLNYLFQLMPFDENSKDKNLPSDVATMTYVNNYTCVPRISYMKNGIRLDWDAVNGAHGYEIHRSNERGGSADKIIYNYKEESYIDHDIEYNTTYWYRIKALVEHPVASFDASGSLVKYENFKYLTKTEVFYFESNNNISKILPIYGGIYALSSSGYLYFYSLDKTNDKGEITGEVEISSYHNKENPFNVLDLVVKGNFIYLLCNKQSASDKSFLKIMNMNTPTDLKPVVGEVENFPTNAKGIILDNDILYVLSNHIYFNRNSLVNPYNTIFTYQFSTAGYVKDFTISNGKGYLLNTDPDPLKYYDFTLGTMPIFMDDKNTTDSFENTIKIEWQGNLFYALKENVFQVYEINNDKNFSLKGIYPESSDDSGLKFKDFAVLGNRVFIYVESIDENQNSTGKLICLELSQTDANQQG